MKKLLSIILCLSFMLLINNNCFAQESTDKQQGQHSVYVEFWGNVGVNSIGYDYVLPLGKMHKTSCNCGFQFGAIKLMTSATAPEGRTYYGDLIWYKGSSISPQVSYLYGKDHYLEVGVGLTYNFDNKIRWRWNDYSSYKNYWHIPFRIGYRYQPEKNGYFFKVAYTPLLMDPFKGKSSYLVHLWGGVALGYTF